MKVASDELEKLRKYRYLLEDITELRKPGARNIRDDLDVMAEYMARLKEAAELTDQLG